MVESLTGAQIRQLRKDGAALTHQGHELLDRLNLAEQQVVRANTEAVRNRVMRQLAGIGVDRLAPAIGSRHSKLAEHGYRTLADLTGVPPAQLTGIRGIGPKTANAAVAATRAAFDDIASTTSAQITADPGDTTSQDLIAALLAYQHAQQSIGPIADGLAGAIREVPDALAHTKWAGWGLIAGLLGRRRREQANAGATVLQRWMHWADNPQVRQRIDIGLAARTAPNPTPADLIAAYERDPMGLYGRWKTCSRRPRPASNSSTCPRN